MLLDPKKAQQLATARQPPQRRYSPTFLRLTLGIVYLHFGYLKFYPDLSPAETLASQTVMGMSWHWLDAHTSLRLLAILECAIGLGFLFHVWMRGVFVLFVFHMIGTFVPLYVLPEFAFKIAPLAPTLEGQYILKNVVFVAAGWTVLLPYVLEGSRFVEGSRLVEGSRVPEGPSLPHGPFERELESPVKSSAPASVASPVDPTQARI
jgi:uncharacterized membrane protein YkgB